MFFILILILAVILGVGVSLFAGQNHELVSVNLAYLHKDNVPLFIVVLVSLLIGLVVAWIFAFINSVSSSITMFGKDVKIKRANSEVESLRKRIKDLEIENTKLSRTFKNTP